MQFAENISRFLGGKDEPHEPRGPDVRDAMETVELTAPPGNIVPLKAFDPNACQKKIDAYIKEVSDADNEISGIFKKYRARDADAQSRRATALRKLHREQAIWKAETEKLMKHNDVRVPDLEPPALPSKGDEI